MYGAWVRYLAKFGQEGGKEGEGLLAYFAGATLETAHRPWARTSAGGPLAPLGCLAPAPPTLPGSNKFPLRDPPTRRWRTRRLRPDLWQTRCQPPLSPNLDCQRPREAGEPAASAGALRRLGGRREAWKVRAEGPPGVPVRAALERLKQRRRASTRSSQASLLGSGARRWGPDRIPQIPPGSLVAKSHPTSSTFPLAPVSPGTLTLPHLVSGSLRTREIPAWTFRRKSE